MNIAIPVADQREVILITRKKVLELTRHTVDEITEMQIDLAFEWLEMIGCVGPMQTQMASTPEFWNNFWKPEWHRLDLMFLKHHHQFHPAIDYKNRYYYFHASIRFLDKPHVHASYHQAIKSIVKAKTV